MIASNVDLHVEVAKIQKEIEEHLGLEKDMLVFEYSTTEGKSKLDFPARIPLLSVAAAE